MSAMAAEFTAKDSDAFAYRRTIVVSRLASPTEVLTVSDAGPITEDTPFPIRTTRVAVGIRRRRLGDISETFELLQSPPENVRLSASFVPLLGEIELNIEHSNPTLRGEFEILKRPHMSNRYRWKVVGHHISWSGELVPSSRKWL
ncbi:MAG: hypothetical protein ABJF50_06880 [Paracoccaceae bacterium]